MQFLYNLSVGLMGIGLRLASIFNDKARLGVAGRKKLLDKIKSDLKGNQDNIIWMHCASVGEFEQGRPVIDLIKEKNPDQKILLTFFSPSGYEMRKNYKGADWVYYLPLDSKSNAKQFLDLVQPKLALFVKYEIWPNLFREMKTKGIPLYLFSANFRENQRFFKSDWWADALRCCNHIFVQNKESANLLAGINYDQYTICGDTRFDRVNKISSSIEKLPLIEDFKKDKMLLVSGSSWPEDEKLLREYLKEMTPDLKVIIAPHELGEKRLKDLKSSFGVSSIMYSEYQQNENSNYDVLIIDNIGMLSRIYAYADLCQIGGGFGAGIHNTLEAAAFGVPIIFGPKYEKFNEAKELIKRGCAVSVDNQKDFNQIVHSLIKSELKRTEIRQASEIFMKENLGASEIILEKIFS